MEISRREFIGDATKLLLLTPAAAAFLAEMQGAETKPDDTYKLAEHYWAMSIDIEKCIGCGNCVGACAKENGVPEGFYRTWVEEYEVKGWDDLQPQVDSPDGGMHGFPDRKATGKTFFVPKLCNHCAHSPCVQVCPVGATFETPDGLVLVDKEYCLGCRYCVQACPYGCRYIDPERQVVDKCTFCYHRISQGLTTACCEACPTGARTLADLKDPNDPIHAFLRENSVQVLKPQMATGPKVYYKLLDQAVR
ncbi:MAG: 4Fe-4S dicluster domain-containing protein [Acidobacteriota bacterium]